MAAYRRRRVDDLRRIVTCGLTACTPGSASGPMLEYGKPLPSHAAVSSYVKLVHQPLWSIDGLFTLGMVRERPAPQLVYQDHCFNTILVCYIFR